jgi:hypothetical protein
MANCGCPFCRGVRLIVYGCGDTLPRGTPLGSYSPASAGGYNPDALPSTDAYGNSGRANEALANRDYAGYIAAQDLAYGLAYPLSGNPWSRF